LPRSVELGMRYAFWYLATDEHIIYGSQRVKRVGEVMRWEGLSLQSCRPIHNDRDGRGRLIDLGIDQEPAAVVGRNVGFHCEDRFQVISGRSDVD